jgi:hypothetical protein
VGGTCDTHVGGERCLQGFVGRPDGKRPLERPKRRWDDNIKMELWEIWIHGSNWIQLSQYRVRWRAFVSTVMNLRVP